MTFKPTLDGCRIVLEQYVGGALWATNHLWFEKDSYSEVDQQALANQVMTSWNYGGYTTNVSDLVTQRVKSVDERSYDGAILYNESGIQGLGINGGDLLPANVALGITLRTASRGRAYRGRLYMTGFTEQGWDETTFAASVGSGCVGMLLAVAQAAQNLGWTWGVRSRQVDKVVRTNCIITEIISHEVRSLAPVTQRRRARRS